jgi:hypothetical protein
MEWVVFYKVGINSAWLVNVGLSEERAIRMAATPGWHAVFWVTVDEIAEAVAENPRITADDEPGGVWMALYRRGHGGANFAWRPSAWWPSRETITAIGRIIGVADEDLAYHVCSVGRLAEHLLKGRDDGKATDGVQSDGAGVQGAGAGTL